MDLQLLFKQYLHHKQFINSSHFDKEMVVTCDKSAPGARRVHLINHQRSHDHVICCCDTHPLTQPHIHTHIKKKKCAQPANADTNVCWQGYTCLNECRYRFYVLSWHLCTLGSCSQPRISINWMLILIHAPDVSLHRELFVGTEEESISGRATVAWRNASNSH